MADLVRAEIRRGAARHAPLSPLAHTRTHGIAVLLLLLMGIVRPSAGAGADAIALLRQEWGCLVAPSADLSREERELMFSNLGEYVRHKIAADPPAGRKDGTGGPRVGGTWRQLSTEAREELTRPLRAEAGHTSSSGVDPSRQHPSRLRSPPAELSCFVEEGGSRKQGSSEEEVSEKKGGSDGESQHPSENACRHTRTYSPTPTPPLPLP